MSTVYDLVIVGAGSGGIGAAVTAGRMGLKTLLVEAREGIGGTAVDAGVCAWEPCVGGTSLPCEIYRRLKARPKAVGIYSIGRHFCWQTPHCWPHNPDACVFPGGELLIDPDRRYSQTLQRHCPAGQMADEAWKRRQWHGVVFEPEAYRQVAKEMLAETPCVEVLCNTRLLGVQRGGAVVRSAALSDGRDVTADAWIDASGDGVLCEKAGCEMLLGQDPRQRFGEPGAPEQASDMLNGVTLCYRISPSPEAAPDRPGDVPAACWWASHFPPMACNQLPGGDRMCNMLPTMSGAEAHRLGAQAAYDQCARRVKAHWAFVQRHWPEFRAYRLVWIAPMLGVRESRRVVCRHMLTENEIAAGLFAQGQDIVAICDHPMDPHGTGAKLKAVGAPYGVPFDCLKPRELDNVLVACRAAGFSAIAASSCRLSRTLMALGEAAAVAVAVARRRNCLPGHTPIDLLRQELRRQNAQLDWPTPPELSAYLAADE